MSVIKIFPFDNTVNYTKVNTEVSSGAGRLILIPKPGETFNQAFAASAGFTFDAAKTEFVGGKVQQKDTRPSLDATFGANYSIDEDGNWGDGNLNVTLNNGATVSGGRLDLKGGAAKNIEIVATSMINPLKGFVLLKYTPDYTNNPTAEQIIFDYSDFSGFNGNRMFFKHDGASAWRITAFTDLGAVGINNAGFGTTFLTSGVTYELEINWDFTPGFEKVNFFLNGAQQGSTLSNVVSRSDNITNITYMQHGGPANADFSLDDLVYGTLPRHTAPYTAGYVVNDSIYLADTIDLPDFAYAGLGTIQSIETFATTEGGAPRYTFEGQYWSGAAWVASNGTYAQANDKTTAITNLPTLDMTGQSAISVQTVWQNQNTQASVDDLTLGYTGQEYPTEGTLLTNDGFVAKTVNSFLPVEIDPAGTSVKYIWEVNSINRYHDGTAWTNSNGSAAQANTLAEVLANLDTLLTINSAIKILVVLVSDQTATPEIDLITVSSDFGALAPTLPTQCQVYGFVVDSENQPIVGAVVSMTPNRAPDEYTEAANRIIGKTISKTTNSEGFFSADLIISDDFEVDGAQKMRYVLSIKIAGQDLPIFKNGITGETANSILFEVPNQPTLNITSKIGAV